MRCEADKVSASKFAILIEDETTVPALNVEQGQRRFP